MKIRLKIILLIFSSALLISSLIYVNSKIPRYEAKNVSIKNCLVTIAVVVCGAHRVDEALVMVKSALIFNSKADLNFVIVTERELHEILDVKLTNLKDFREFSHEILELKFPDENREVWMKLFKPCAAQRLFLPSLLPHIDSLAYVDCDVLFLSPPEELDNHFR